jgi:2'-5' RNA ligase
LILSLNEKLETPSYVKWVKKENLHITLKFFGETEKNNLIEEKMRNLENEISAFDISLKGVGAFPDLKKAKILWVGVEKGKGSLSQLFSITENEVAALGFEREKRNFHPHITFARVKKGKYSLTRDIDFSFGPFWVEEISLFKSTLTPNGPIYEILSEIPLRRGKS